MFARACNRHPVGWPHCHRQVSDPCLCRSPTSTRGYCHAATSSMSSRLGPLLRHRLSAGRGGLPSARVGWVLRRGVYVRQCVVSACPSLLLSLAVVGSPVVSAASPCSCVLRLSRLLPRRVVTSSPLGSVPPSLNQLVGGPRSVEPSATSGPGPGGFESIACAVVKVRCRWWSAVRGPTGWPVCRAGGVCRNPAGKGGLVCPTETVYHGNPMLVKISEKGLTKA